MKDLLSLENAIVETHESRNKFPSIARSFFLGVTGFVFIRWNSSHCSRRYEYTFQLVRIKTTFCTTSVRSVRTYSFVISSCPVRSVSSSHGFASNAFPIGPCIANVQGIRPIMLLHFEFSARGSTFGFPLALRGLHERLRTLQTHKECR